LEKESLYLFTISVSTRADQGANGRATQNGRSDCATDQQTHGATGDQALLNGQAPPVLKFELAAVLTGDSHGRPWDWSALTKLLQIETEHS
jgi:hypothetical protein